MVTAREARDPDVYHDSNRLLGGPAGGTRGVVYQVTSALLFALTCVTGTPAITLRYA